MNMGDNVFDQMTSSLLTVDNNNRLDCKVYLSKYVSWQQSFLFDALKNQRYGQSFCNEFDIADHILFFEKDMQWADEYIRTYYIK